MVSDELLKTLAEDGCQSNGPPVVQACDFILKYAASVKLLKLIKR